MINNITDRFLHYYIPTNIIYLLIRNGKRTKPLLLYHTIITGKDTAAVLKK